MSDKESKEQIKRVMEWYRLVQKIKDQQKVKKELTS